MPTTPELIALEDVCARLDKHRVAYMLTGSLAMSFYARPRMTRHIDLVIALDAAETERLVAALGSGYHAHAGAIPAAIRDERHSLSTVVKIDLIPRKESPYRHSEYRLPKEIENA